MKTLVEDKNVTQKRFDLVLKTVENLSLWQESRNTSLSRVNIDGAVTQPSFVQHPRAEHGGAGKSGGLLFNNNSLLLQGSEHRSQEIDHHCMLVECLLDGFGAVQYKITTV